MFSLNDDALARAAAIAGLISLSLISYPAIAGSGHGHDNEHSASARHAADVPRISAASESYELVGSANDGVLSLRLKRKPDGSTVANAHIELTVDGESGEARAAGNGSYVYRSASLNKKGEHEVIITVKDGKKSDLLIGVLKQGAGPKKHAGHGTHAGHGGHGEKKKHAGRDGHGGDGHEDEGVVKLTPEVMREFGVTTEQAGPGNISDSIKRPAEVSFNMDRFTHVVPRVAGIATSINASQGDTVKAGQVLAILDSRELAELKAAYLAALERFGFAKEDFERVQKLRNKKITSEKTYLASRTAFAEARIAMRSAKQKLNSIGIGNDVLAGIANEPDAALTQYSLRAPMNGMVIKRHLVKGESVPNNREAFVIADPSTVWINISIYAEDLPKVDAGLDVTLQTESGHTAKGKISFVSLDVSEQTRTATARVVLVNPPREFRPGMFINAIIDITNTKVALRIPKSALHTQDGKEVVFASEGGAFKPRPVKIGRRNGRYAEVVAGLNAGDVIAAKGAFLIKSQLSKASFGDGHNH